MGRSVRAGLAGSAAIFLLWAGVAFSQGPDEKTGKGGEHHHGPSEPSAPAKAGSGGGDEPPIRMKMERLHEHGGVPPGWKFRFPAGDPAEGRRVFVMLECYTCHHVAGEKFPKYDPKPVNKGPELTGMGAHHPVEYFIESVVNPNRVIVEGPGYTGKDGLSIMPSYNHLLTVDELVHLGAYLKSLKEGGHDGAGSHAADPHPH